MTQLLHPQDAADRLQVSRRQVYKLIDNGDLTGVRIGSTKSIRVTTDSLEALIERGVTNAAS